MTDKEIIKALECCVKNNNCEGCPLDYLTFSSQCASELAIKSLDLINRQKERIKTLTNSRDNWSRIAEEFDKASRETEKEVECLQAEIDELKHEREVLIEDIHHSVDKINEQLEEIERLNNLKRFEKFICERIHRDKEHNVTWDFATKEAEQEAFKQELEKLFDISTARTEAIKEFAERLKDDMVPNIDDTYIESFVEEYIDNLVKEMAGEEWLKH